MTRVPSGGVISARVSSPVLAALLGLGDSSTSGASAVICTGVNTGIGSGANSPRRT